MVTREHGTRARYVFGESGQDRSNGCRCELCLDANRSYARYQAKRKRLESLGRTDGPWASPLVDATPARDHLAALADVGIGYKRAALLAGVNHKTIADIRHERTARITRAVSNAILAIPVDTEQLADQALVDASATWKLVGLILRRHGWTKARLSAELGQGGRALQLGRHQITARNARAVTEIAASLGIDTTPPDGRRFPADPLLDLAADTIMGLSRRTGVDQRQWHRWKRDGIPAGRADDVAVALGLHPAEVWPDWYADLEDVAS